MVDIGVEPPEDRARIGWWMFILILAAAAAFIAYSFVGLVVLGVFGYYTTRPIYQRLNDAIDSDGIAAWVTVLLVLLPIVILLFYTGFQLFQQAQQFLGGTTGSLPLGDFFGALSTKQRQTLTSAIQNPRQFITNPQQTLQTVLQAGLRALSAIIGALLLVALAVTLSYFLLKNDDALADGLRQLFGGQQIYSNQDTEAERLGVIHPLVSCGAARLARDDSIWFTREFHVLLFRAFLPDFK